MEELFIPLESPGARISRVSCLKTLIDAALPGNALTPHDVYDACEDMYPDIRIERGGAEMELGFSLLSRSEVEAQDRLDQAIVTLYYDTDLTTEELLSSRNWETIVGVASELIDLLIRPETWDLVDEPAWNPVCVRALQSLCALPEKHARLDISPRMA